MSASANDSGSSTSQRGTPRNVKSGPYRAGMVLLRFPSHETTPCSGVASTCRSKYSACPSTSRKGGIPRRVPEDPALPTRPVPSSEPAGALSSDQFGQQRSLVAEHPGHDPYPEEVVEAAHREPEPG